MNSPSPTSSNPIAVTIAPDVLLALVLVPTMVAMVGSRALLKGLQELGEASEELFRSDRLPTLPHPPSNPQA